MKIIVDKAIPFIKGRFPKDIDVCYLPGNEINSNIVKDADALIVRTRTKCDENLLKDSKVKLVVTATIGTDHIDLPWCESNGIIVRNAPGCNAPGVAQYVFSSLFNQGFDPDTHTLGIIGHGNVGSVVADWAKQMGIRVLISDSPRQEDGLKDVDYISKEILLRQSDAVTLHVPLTVSGKFPTKNLIGEKELKMMKPGAILVNSSRGGVVDEKVLKQFLSEKSLKAVIDVWENESNIDKELIGLASIATPHIAGYSAEGKMRATNMALMGLQEELGIEVDLSGMECVPDSKVTLSKDLIQDSYNPIIDYMNLMTRPNDFEILRNEYNYRHEPLFYGSMKRS